MIFRKRPSDSRGLQIAESKTIQYTATVRVAVSNVFQILLAALREIFDESSYTRFLSRRKLASSPAAYQEFTRENELSRARRPRCC